MPSFRLVPLAALTTTLLVVPVTAASASDDSLSDQMARLRQCESSSNYRANTGNGYYGAYQFSRSTWRSLGYPNRPDQNAGKTQDNAVVKLHSSQGWRPWPACARKEHLH
jgi:hypothetical protein